MPTVAAIIAAGLTPAAAEIMDALAISAAEKAVDCRYPAGAGAVLVVEVDGPAAEVAAEHAAIDAICRANKAFEVRTAVDAAERAALWRGRKSAFAAVGRISPDYIVQDGVVPRTALATVLTEIEALAAPSTAYGWPTSSTPATATCTRSCSTTARSPGALDAAEKVSGAILNLLHRARRVDHRRARRRRREGGLHGEHVHRRRPRHDATGPLRVRSGRAGQPGQGLPDAATVRRAAGRTAAAAAWRTRSPPRGPPAPRWTTSRRSGDDHHRRRRRRHARARLRTPRPVRPTRVWRRQAPRWVAAPASGPALAEVVRVCAERELTVVARGEGGKLDWGNPPRTGRRAGRHGPAGRRLPARRRRSRRHGRRRDAAAGRTGGAGAKRNQRLAIDPGSADATIGGMLATGEAGPLRLGYGTPRDQLIGVEFVRPTASSRTPAAGWSRTSPATTSASCCRLVRHARRHHVGDLPGAPDTAGARLGDPPVRTPAGSS